MTSVVYNISSSSDDDDIQVIRTRKSETLPNLPSVTIIKTVETTVKTTSVVNNVKKTAPVLLSSSVTLTKKSSKSTAHSDTIPTTASTRNSPKREDALTNKSAASRPLHKTDKPIEQIVLDDSDNEIEWLGVVKSEASGKNSTHPEQSKRKSTPGNTTVNRGVAPAQPVRRKPLMIDLSLDDDNDDGDVTVIQYAKSESKANSIDSSKQHSDQDLDVNSGVPEATSQSKDNDQQEAETHKESIADSDEDDRPVVGNATESLLNKLITLIEKVGFSKEAKKRVIRKITNYYSTSESDFTESQEFISSVGKLISDIKDLVRRGPNKPLVVDEIAQKVREFLSSLVRHSGKASSKLRKLYSLYEKLNRRIEKLEQAEVGSSSDSDYENAYELCGRYKAKAVQVYSRICELEGKADHADRLIKRQFQYRGPGPVPITRALEKFVNKTRQFPNFRDVLQLVKKVNTEEGLGYGAAQVMTLAQDVFVKCGDELQRRRMHDERCAAYSYLPDNSTDPADNDPALCEKLEKNRLIARSEKEVLAEFKARSEKEEPQEEATQATEDSEMADSDDEEAPTEQFMDSEEEISYLGSVEERRQKSPEDAGPPSKISKKEG